MAGKRRYRLNPETLLYEIEKASVKSRLFHAFSFLIFSAIATIIVWWFYTSVLNLELPKTILLRKQNADWVSKMEQMQKHLDVMENALAGIAGRDDGVYRNIFGMNSIDPDRRLSGFGGVNRYAYLDDEGASSLLRKTVIRTDKLMNQTYVQTLSFDDVSAISRRAGDMASSIPLTMPVNPRANYHVSSRYGYRSDPIYGSTRFHAGLDFAMDAGNALYATGDGVVEKVSFEIRGYGNNIIINHGFGYKTRYAHMKTVAVVEGMKVKRGTYLGTSGRSGKATGPHLHYEVLYRGAHVNPDYYVDYEMAPEEYDTMIKQAAEASGVIPPSKLPGKR